MLPQSLRETATALTRCLGGLATQGASFRRALSVKPGLERRNAFDETTSFSADGQPAARLLSAGLRLSQWQPCYRAVLVDAAGTFLLPSEPVTTVYLRYARPYGCQLDDNEVLQRFRRVYNMPWPNSYLRYVGDARPFWQRIVEHSTGCNKPEVSEAIYQYYSRAEAWNVTPGAVEALKRLRSAGVLLAVVSNFDTRLRPLLRELGVEDFFDAVIVSAEVCAEKPNPVIFDAAVRSLNAAATTRGTIPITALGHRATCVPVSDVSKPGASSVASFSDVGPLVPGSSFGVAASTCTPDFGPLAPEQVVHVGDDRRNDCWGARDAGITAWLWGYDVHSWTEVADRVLYGRQADDFYEG